MRVARQLDLAMQAPRGAAARLPFAVSPRKIRRAARRRFASLGLARSELLAAAFDQALLDQVRHELRKRARGEGRNSKLRIAAYLATTEGRMAMRLMDRLSARLAAQETRLCG
jgi:hypothetical protein